MTLAKFMDRLAEVIGEFQIPGFGRFYTVQQGPPVEAESIFFKDSDTDDVYINCARLGLHDPVTWVQITPTCNYDQSGAELPGQIVDIIIHSFTLIDGGYTGTLDLRGNSPPSADGLADVQTLRDGGATVLLD